MCYVVKYICKKPHRILIVFEFVFCIVDTGRRYSTWSIVNRKSPSFCSDRFRVNSIVNGYILKCMVSKLTVCCKNIAACEDKKTNML